MFKGAKICALEDIFGQIRVRDAAMHEGKELPALSYELFKRRRGHRNAEWEVFASHPDWMWKRLAKYLTRTNYTFAIEATGTILAFHGFLLETHVCVCAGKRMTLRFLTLGRPSSKK
jgi:hypothetical protein